MTGFRKDELYQIDHSEGAEKEVFLDLETRSRVNLPKAGAHEYALDSSTEVLCLAYSFADCSEIEVWIPGKERPPEDLTEHIRIGGTLCCHNAQFERLIIWNILCPDHGLPRPRLEQFKCSATVARSNGLPGKLEDIPKALGLSVRKDPRGEQLIQMLCIPIGARKNDPRPYYEDSEFRDEPTLLAELVEYNKNDVRVLREILKAMRRLSNQEWAEYWAQESINDRGIKVDRHLCTLGAGLAKEETAALDKRIGPATGGAIQKARSPKLATWVYDRLPAGVKKKMIRTDKKTGVTKG